MHGNSKFKLAQQLVDAQRGLEMILESDPENKLMIDIYKNRIAKLIPRVYR